MRDAFEFTVFDLAGSAGVLMIVGAYLALQAGVLLPERPLYSAVNGAGALLVLVSLSVEFNFAAFMVELFWLLISLFGLWRHRRAGRPVVLAGKGRT